MGKANVFGPSSGGSIFFDAVHVDFADDPTPLVSDPMPLEHFDGVSVQLVSGGGRSIEILTGDNVDVSTNTFVFKAGHFTVNDEGATFVLAGSADGNDGTYTIDTVVDASTVTTAETPGGTDEDFDPDTVTVDLIQASPPGSWDFRVSNSYSPGTTIATPNDGSPWTPIGDQFSPAIDVVSEQYVKDTANSANQYCQASPLVAAAVQLRFTPTAGAAGPISAYLCAKGNR